MSEKMIFCIGEGKYVRTGAGYQKNLMMFNKPVTESEYDKANSLLEGKNFKLPITKIVDGELEIQSYKNAWEEMWGSLSSDDKKVFTTLTNFDADIFEQITGIEVSGHKEELLKKADELITKANELKEEAERLKD